MDSCQLGDLAQCVEMFGELTDDNRGPGEELWCHGQMPEPVGQPEPSRAEFRSNGVVSQGLLAGDGVLMHSDVAGTVQCDRPERHRAIAVSDHDDPAGAGCLDGSTGLGQDEPVGRVDGHEVVCLEVGKASQEREVEGLAHRGPACHR